jgi:hypothetical protein
MSSPKYRKAMPPSSERPVFDRLKEHPIWVFCSGAAATAAFVIAVILPVTTAYLRAEIENLTPAREQLQKANLQIVKLNDELKILVKDRDEKLATLKKERDEALLKNPFTAGSAYPKGLSSVMIGSPISKIAEAFPNAKIKTTVDDDSTTAYQSVDTGHSVFKHVAYYYDKNGKSPNTITQILLQSFESGVSHDYLYGQLTQLNGPPNAESKGRYYWEIKPREAISLEFGNLHIYKYGDVPMWVQNIRTKKSR